MEQNWPQPREEAIHKPELPRGVHKRLVAIPGVRVRPGEKVGVVDAFAKLHEETLQALPVVGVVAALGAGVFCMIKRKRWAAALSPVASIQPGRLRITTPCRATVQDLFLIDQLEVPEVVAAATLPHNGVLSMASAGCSCPAGAC